MSFWSEVEGIFDVGGDPEAIHGAAAACRTLASDLLAARSELDGVAKGLEQSWKGLGDASDTSGSVAFQKTWRTFSTSVPQYADRLITLAIRLDSLADVLSSAQVQVKHMKETALASLGIGVLATVFTAGMSDAAAEASAMADIAVATGMMTELDAAVADAAAMVNGLLAAFAKVAAMFAMGAGWDVATIMSTRLAEGLNPFDPANYSASDVSNVLLSGDLSLIWGFTGKIPMLKNFLKSSPVLGKAAYSFTSSVTGGPFWQIMIMGLPANKWSTWDKILNSALISGATAAGVGGLGSVPGLGNVLNGQSGDATPETSIGKALNNASQVTGITQGDWVRNGVSLPASVVKYALYGASAPASPHVPETPLPPPAVPVPRVPLPEAPGLPPGSTLHLVQPGENLSVIAGGNAALAQRIAKLNGLGDSSVVRPGQVLIIPPAG